ncbi:heat shock Hsp30-like protein [Aspergillus sclerotioniger CBS 115572]|uniref:Heat shock Hsp30-like protein n=1 Tax=Aspergillus sclerotioniger CBS 115572 TaxID=1450535 RepID=A0A317VPT0_9EURO|nr:heat shock Hsp30-like protein [Aspergillus sclerotioniger CBS 115572]PWY76356.1 heat shock Hsp30-like protein [Aspergillus sclerotioniger CBS 115572]
MAFFPRFTGDFAPLFQLLDDYDVHRSSRPKSRKTTPVRSFTPKFDVYEVNDVYHLDGELPGVEPSNIEIEFADPHTLVIKGRVKNDVPSPRTTAPTSATKLHQPTVEDEDEIEEKEPAGSSDNRSAQRVGQKQPEPTCKYWLSERQTGEYYRTFNFPTRVHQDAVKANLTNGILSLLVPKEPAPQVKKIRLE